MALLNDRPVLSVVPTTIASTLSFSDLTIYPYERRILWQEKEIKLTNLEFETLLYLARHPDRVFTKRQIYQHLYEEEPIRDVDNIIYCLIRSLCKKLEPDPRHPKYIHTVRGVGYKFEPLSGE